MPAENDSDKAASEPLLHNMSADGPADTLWQEELLATLDNLERGKSEPHSPRGHEDGDDGEPFEMEELIAEQPDDVISYLEHEGLLKLGEFEVDECVALKAFGQETFLTTGHDNLDFGWETLWRDKLASKYGSKLAGATTCRWSASVTLEAYVVNLLEAAAQGHAGLLQPLIQRHQMNGCSTSVFALPAVQAVIHFKWRTWAQRYLIIELLAYLIWLSSFVTFTLAFVPEDPKMSLLDLLSTARGSVAVWSNIAATAAMLVFLYMEICTMLAYRWGWLTFGNLADFCSYGLQIAILLMHTFRIAVGSNSLSLLVAIQHVLLWTKMHYYARVFNPTKNLFLDTLRIVVGDLKWFLLFLGLTMMGFGFAFYALFRNDRGPYRDFQNIWHAFASMFEYLLAMFDMNVFYKSTMPVASLLLFCVYEFVFNILLLNLLIAIMTTSYAKVNQTEGLRFLLNRARIIGELEATLSSWLPLWAKGRDWTPKYVHVLKRAPPTGYDPSLQSIWSGMGMLETNVLGAQAETRLRVEEIERNLHNISRKLDFMAQMLITAPAGPRAAAMANTTAWAREQASRPLYAMSRPILPADDSAAELGEPSLARPSLARASLARGSQPLPMHRSGSQHARPQAAADDEADEGYEGSIVTLPRGAGVRMHRRRARPASQQQQPFGTPLKKVPSL